MNKSVKTSKSSTLEAKVKEQLMSQQQLAALGGGHVAYIRTMTAEEAKRMFPALADLPKGVNMFALHSADGTPLALTDSRQAALAQAMEGDLVIASVH